MHKILTVALLCLATPALAGSPCTDQYPPAKYRHEPSQPYTLAYVSGGAALAICGSTFACTLRSEREVYIANDLTTAKCGDGIAVSACKICLMTHEFAHLNGWPSDHPMR